jgi:hypothetical protein
MCLAAENKSAAPKMRATFLVSPADDAPIKTAVATKV